MSKPAAAAFAITASILTACTAPDDYAGEVVNYNGEMVFIEGPLNQPDGFGGDARPTPAMQASAEDVCQGPARFVGWDDEQYGGDPVNPILFETMGVTYRFLCR
ncbi:hypothetical protein [Primorskyibacter flagellatus]|uniref:hypothetical protein n=1 Tax=Primorskyibacter flagellatus TaxID=1387277 RepID=UPI003A8D661E